jgi:D-methionine transport system substrate-binding protein
MIKKYAALFVLCLLAACSSSRPTLKVAATPIPQAELLEEIKSDLAKQGIRLEIVVVNDYNIPNRALVDHAVDANFFQHIPFLDEQIRQFQYPIEAIAKIEIEPMGIYSKKLRSLADLRNGSKVAIPNDPTNEARALFLLQAQGLIQLSSNALTVTTAQISDNPKQLRIIEIDAAMVPRALDDVAIALINTNYALEARLSPHQALALESADSPYANVLVVRSSDVERPDIQALKTALTSEKIRLFIEKKYKGAVLPAF